MGEPTVHVAGSNYGIISTGPDAKNTIVNSYEAPVGYFVTRVGTSRPGRSEGGPWPDTPSSLLLAEHQIEHRIVPFTGREQELAELLTWCTESAPHRAARLVHGPGGQGKTRLALHLAAQLDDAWSSWRVTDRAGRAGDGAAAPPRPEPGHGTLVIVDYTERWSHSRIKEIISDLTARFPGRLRLLLVARAAAGWWDPTRHTLRDCGFAVDQRALPALVGGREGGRRDAFLAARDGFARELSVTDPEAVPVPGDLDDERYNLMLTVHMAALVAVDAHRRGQRPPADPAQLSAYLLDRERAFWEEAHAEGSGRVVANADEMAQIAYVATLVGRLSYEEAGAVLARVGVESALPVGSLLKAHSLVYPSGTDDGYLEPVYPDRLGEDFVALSMPGHTSAHAPDPWTSGCLRRLLTQAPEEPVPSWMRHACAVLFETASRWPHVGAEHLSGLLRSSPQLATAAGGAALAQLPALPGIDEETLLEVAVSIGVGRDSDLDLGVAALMLATESEQLAAAGSTADRAWIEGHVSYRLGCAGLWQAAIRPATEAVALYRELVAGSSGDDRHLYQLRLAQSLDRLGIDLELRGRHADALPHTREAIGILRRLIEVGGDPDGRAGHQLGYSLANQAGRRALPPAERLSLGEEAVAVCRRWEEEHPGRTTELAGSLENLADALDDLGRPEEAVERSREAVGLRRAQWLGTPQAFGEYFADSVAGLGRLLWRTGNRAEAEQVLQEAAALFRGLAKANPGMYAARWSQSVFRLAFIDQLAGRAGDAEALYRESFRAVQACAGTAVGWAATDLVSLPGRLRPAFDALPGPLDDVITALRQRAEDCDAAAEADPDREAGPIRLGHALRGLAALAEELRAGEAERRQDT
ncbi:tetratricopeptide repeat protein [Streptacidiphilus anmyonensis]|uniref:tetratricopeptide repeat protein n=1 Tax=Streptacidiphilus anmyonensis TaxID=405782 RepID=UPI0006938B79|nr:tetratricopeptide repeat protein [Streptacidiphilus anmyonensis]